MCLPIAEPTDSRVPPKSIFSQCNLSKNSSQQQCDQNPSMPSDIVYLKVLLAKLPLSLAIGSSEDFPFKNFQPNPNKIEDSLSGAVSDVFKNTFGWGECTPIKARGLHIEAAADVLVTYLIHKECQNNLAPITAWVEKLTRMASLAYDAENYTLFLGFNVESASHFEQLCAFGRDTYHWKEVDESFQTVVRTCL